MGRYKSRIKLKYGSKCYEKRLDNNHVTRWFELTDKGWQIIRDGVEYSRLEKLLREQRVHKEWYDI